MTKFIDSLGLKRLVTKIAEAVGKGTWLPVKKGKGERAVEEGIGTALGSYSHAENNATASGDGSHAEGNKTTALGDFSHTEGDSTTASGFASHAQGSSNYDDPSFMDVVGVGNDNTTKNASVIYVKRDTEGYPDQSDPKNGYQYLIGIGGYQGRNIAEGMKSVQEVIADLEKGVAATETMTVEEIREIMSA
jgi:hypothetical protein